MPGVNSKNNKIVIRGRFSDLRYDILEKFNENDIVELQAEDKFIELAIKLSEDLVQNSNVLITQIKHSMKALEVASISINSENSFQWFR